MKEISITYHGLKIGLNPKLRVKTTKKETAQIKSYLEAMARSINIGIIHKELFGILLDDIKRREKPKRSQPCT